MKILSNDFGNLEQWNLELGTIENYKKCEPISIRTPVMVENLKNGQKQKNMYIYNDPDDDYEDFAKSERITKAEIDCYLFHAILAPVSEITVDQLPTRSRPIEKAIALLLNPKDYGSMIRLPL
ncbi:hypothetical protein NPIL_96441 [Nephila pilipes]|uniref:Uncharacterized protein n=1 Tax=Nephila pilipes TaxID=299642 RepID=A0A8X6TIX9_NEPPI|nr:hypothetical protein NPIL_96441 [Nephila pilipes]